MLSPTLAHSGLLVARMAVSSDRQVRFFWYPMSDQGRLRHFMDVLTWPAFLVKADFTFA
jgi:hypothetical protein